MHYNQEHEPFDVRRKDVPIIKITPPKIEDEQTAASFIADCVEAIGLGFHPDTPFCEYVSEDGAKIFSTDEAQMLDDVIDLAYCYCDPYTIALQAAQPLLSMYTDGNPPQ